ncbi:tRNA (guanine-N(1)-)-methyltransferase [Deltaproteobacteria bacterium]|nr:tRNA (guanine-N(1)-)-methyltransferase [Deltaproteobacteria bacterium]
MRVDILTLFPEMVTPALTGSILGRAAKAGAWSLGVHDVRDHGLGKHRTVDDAPFGGGSGMVMRPDVVAAAIAEVRRPESYVVLLEASGTRFTQAVAQRLSERPHLVFVCGHYEGVDARVRDVLVDEAISIGDYVLTGGELAACVIVDAVVRLLPGALGNDASIVDESFSAGLLEYPHYTRPRDFEGHLVPDVLLSGDHGKVATWRKRAAEARTWALRPDLAAALGLRDPALVAAETQALAEAKEARAQARRAARAARREGG